MNILRIIYDFVDENNITEGLAPAPYELSLAQAKLGHKVYVLCGNLNKKNILAKKFKYELASGGVVVYNLPRGLRGFGPFLTTSVFVLPYYFYLRVFKKITLVHNHQHMGLWFLIYKRIFGFIDKIPVVSQIHITAKGREQIFKEKKDKVPFLTKNVEHRLHKFSDFLQTKVANKLVVVAEDVKQELINYYNVPPSKITIVESGVNTDRYKKQGDSLKTGFTKDSIVLGNIGRLSKRKGIHLILKALTVLPENYKFALWGEWDKDYQKELSELIKKSNLKHRVQYFGKVSYFDVDKAFRAVDIFLLPSSYEGLPKVVLEALACGNKVIASGFKIKLIVDNLYFLQSLDVNHLIKEIKKVNSSPNKYESTRRVIEENYSWNTKAKEVDKVYNLLK